MPKTNAPVSEKQIIDAIEEATLCLWRIRDTDDSQRRQEWQGELDTEISSITDRLDRKAALAFIDRLVGHMASVGMDDELVDEIFEGSTYKRHDLEAFRIETHTLPSTPGVRNPRL